MNPIPIQHRPIDLPNENFKSPDFLKTFNQIVNYIQNLLEVNKYQML